VKIDSREFVSINAIDRRDFLIQGSGIVSAALLAACDSRGPKSADKLLKYAERIFKQIFGGCQTVIEGVGALRNELSDAHGRGKMNVQPGIHHAAFAVNLAGAVALFLVQSWEVGQREHIAELSPPPPADSPDSA
jgi:hypothetical protein